MKTKTKKDHQPVNASSAAKIGFAGGVLFTFSVLFFVMLSLMVSGYGFEKNNGGTVQQAIDSLTQPSADDIPTEEPAKNVELTDTDHVRGEAAAPVTIVEYSDFECPYCQKFHSALQQAMDNYGDQVKWVYRHYPLPFHSTAQIQAEASECAAELGGADMFWTYADLLFEQSESATEDSLTLIATANGLDEQEFRTCLTDGRNAEKVQSSITEGNNVGVTGTPGNIIIAADGSQRLISGAIPYDALATIIDESLAK